MANKDLARGRRAMYGMRDFKRERVAADEAWWYETVPGIEVIFYTGTPGHFRSRNFLIPWKALRAAVARKDKPHA